MLVYQRVNLHFPMVFLWFSYGFPIKTSIFLWLIPRCLPDGPTATSKKVVVAKGPCAASAHSKTAESWGYPTPAERRRSRRSQRVTTGHWVIQKKLPVKITHEWLTRPGKRLHSELERSTIFLMGKSTISMGHIQNSYVSHYQRVTNMSIQHEASNDGIQFKWGDLFTWVSKYSTCHGTCYSCSNCWAKLRNHAGSNDRIPF